MYNYITDSFLRQMGNIAGIRLNIDQILIKNKKEPTEMVQVYLEHIPSRSIDTFIFHPLYDSRFCCKGEIKINDNGFKSYHTAIDENLIIMLKKIKLYNKISKLIPKDIKPVSTLYIYFEGHITNNSMIIDKNTLKLFPPSSYKAMTVLGDNQEDDFFKKCEDILSNRYYAYDSNDLQMIKSIYTLLEMENI